MCDPFNVPAISSSVSDKKNPRLCPEIQGSVLITACNCNKRNGLQEECRRSECRGRRKPAQKSNEMQSCTHQSFQMPPKTPVCQEMHSSETEMNENCLQVTDDMPIESALKPEEMSDIVYVDYGHNAFQESSGMHNMNPMQASMNVNDMQKMQMPQMQMQPNLGKGDQKMSAQPMMTSSPPQAFYPQQMMAPQNMPTMVQMGDGKQMEMMSAMPAAHSQGQQSFSMPQYSMMSPSPMPQNYSYYPMMQGGGQQQGGQMMMQAPPSMNMQNYQMQNPGQN